MEWHGPFTIRDAVAVNKIIDAAQRCAHVRWLDDGDIAEGVARCIAHDGGGFLGGDEDVRDGFLHVSGITERWLPVVDLIGMVARGEFAVD